MAGGHFISFEGGEGSGKSTQIAALRDALTANGLTVTLTREPGGAPGAEEIRNLLVTGEPDRWDPLSEALLHFAARQDHLTKTIEPALARGEWVLTDRFVDSTVAYQAHGRGLPLDVVEQLRDLVVGDQMPELTLILDAPAEVGLARAAGRDDPGTVAEDRYERMELSFHERLRQGFLAIAESAPERCVVIDATANEEAVKAAILAIVSERFGLA